MNILRGLGQHLFQRHDFDFHLDAGGIGELFLDLIEHDGGRCRLRGKPNLRPAISAADLLEPLGLIVRQSLRIGRRRNLKAAPATAISAEHGEPEGRKSDAGEAHAAQELAF